MLLNLNHQLYYNVNIIGFDQNNQFDSTEGYYYYY